MRTLPALLVVLLASCTFNRDVPAADGVSSVDCGDGGTCPPSADLCATIEPGLRRCVVRASWPSADITRLVVVASNDAPRTRFSRQPGFAKGAIVATVEGRPEQLVATIGTQVVPCGRTGDSYRCDFTVTADTPEGQTLARVEVTDAAGRVTADRVVLDFDFTAPRLIAGSVATRITPPASSPLATLGPQWAPSALATGSELTVSFGLDDFRVPPPALSLGPVQVAAVPSGAAFVATLGVDATLAEGRWPLVARLVDDVGNAREEMLGTFERDDTAPSARVDEVLVERRPFAPLDAGAGLFLSATGGLEPASAVLASTRTSPFPIGVIRVSADGGLDRTALSLADSREVFVTVIDAAGNPSAATRVNRYRLHATPGEGLIDNPSDLERRPGWVPHLLVRNDFSAVGADVAVAGDGRMERIAGRPTWRRQLLEVPYFECAAAMADTANGGMLLGGAWPGCQTSDPQVLQLRGAGVALTTEPIAAGARFWPTYDSLRSRFLLLSAVPNLTNIVVTDGALSRFSSPTGVAFSGGAYDPRRDEVLGVTPGGTLWRLVGTTWVPGGETGRVDAGLVWAPSVDAVLLVGGLDADGGRPFGDVARLDGGRLATLPPGVTQPLASWDFLEHTVRLIDRGRDATWLLIDGGFVAQPATGARIDWWASWPARGDALLNPGAPFASVWRSSQRTPWNLVTLPDGRTEPNLLARPERGDVLVVGGSSGGFPYRFGMSWQHERSTEPFPSPTAFGGSALWGLPDGGLMMVGGATLDATGQPAPNREVWTWSEATGGWTPRWQGAPSTFGTWATPLPDGTVLVAANEQLPQDRATSYRLRLLEDGGVERLPATGDAPSLLSTCAARDDRGAMVLLGGLQQSCGDAGACTRAPTREVYRATSTGWTRDARLRLPSTREGHACAFDGTRQSWLVFGGREGSTPATTLREFGPDGGGWASRADFAPDGRPALREGSSMVFDPSSERLVMVGGRALGSFTGLAELWVLENATVTPGLAWRVSLRELGVPLTARWERLTASAVAGGNANFPDGGAAEGVELLVWVDGQWRALGTWGADAGVPTRESVTATTLDSSWFERHSVSVGVRSVGQRRQGEAELAVDLVEVELDYALTE